jgi:hypothetical protein
VPLTLWVARWRCRFWAGCITNISEPKFPTGTGLLAEAHAARFLLQTSSRRAAYRAQLGSFSVLDWRTQRFASSAYCRN